MIASTSLPHNHLHTPLITTYNYMHNIHHIHGPIHPGRVRRSKSCFYCCLRAAGREEGPDRTFGRAGGREGGRAERAEEEYDRSTGTAPAQHRHSTVPVLRRKGGGHGKPSWSPAVGNCCAGGTAVWVGSFSVHVGGEDGRGVCAPPATPLQHITARRGGHHIMARRPSLLPA